MVLTSVFRAFIGTQFGPLIRFRTYIWNSFWRKVRWKVIVTNFKIRPFQPFTWSWFFFLKTILEQFYSKLSTTSKMWSFHQLQSFHLKLGLPKRRALLSECLPFQSLCQHPTFQEIPNTTTKSLQVLNIILSSSLYVQKRKDKSFKCRERLKRKLIPFFNQIICKM